MKKIIALTLTTVMLLFTVGCGGDLDTEWKSDVSYAGWSKDPLIVSGALNKESLSELGAGHLPIYKIDTSQELESFKATYGGIFDMDSPYEEIPSFEEVTAKYDAEFFEEKTLLIVYVEMATASFRFEASGVTFGEGSITVHVKQANDPDIISEDMAGWLITVSISDEVASECEIFDADFNNMD